MFSHKKRLNSQVFFDLTVLLTEARMNVKSKNSSERTKFLKIASGCKKLAQVVKNHLKILTNISRYPNHVVFISNKCIFCMHEPIGYRV